jgi:putative spermidine/putrescine transport system permease protein
VNESFAARFWQLFIRTLGILAVLAVVVVAIQLLGASNPTQYIGVGYAVAFEIPAIVILAAILAVLTLLLGPHLRPLKPLTRGWGWLVFAISVAYFIVPLIATVVFSLRIRRDYLSLDAYTSVLFDSDFHRTFTYSIVISLFTMVVGMIITVPAAYLVRLRLPQLRPFVEFVTLLPLIIPPIILVYGYIKMYNTSSLLPLTGTAIGTDILLILSYSALGLPYMYRAVDTGLRTIDVQTLTEAATIMGANQITILTRVIFPNILIAVLSGAFLTFAIVVGEFTMASLLGRPAFGTYLQRIGINKSYEPAALAVISFIITWGAMGMIQLLARFAPKTAVRNT